MTSSESGEVCFPKFIQESILESVFSLIIILNYVTYRRPGFNSIAIGFNRLSHRFWHKWSRCFSINKNKAVQSVIWHYQFDLQYGGKPIPQCYRSLPQIKCDRFILSFVHKGSTEELKSMYMFFEGSFRSSHKVLDDLRVT